MTAAKTIGVASAGGAHFVVVDGCLIGEAHKTNAAAWRAADRLANDHLSSAERRADWVADRIIRGDP